MAPSDAPVLQRPASQNSGSDGFEEEDALLTGQRTGKPPATASRCASRSQRWREIGLFVWAVLATAAVIVFAVAWQRHAQTSAGDEKHGAEGGGRPSKPGGKKNLIFMVSDGMGPTSLALTRSWRQYTDHLPWDATLVLDAHLIGQSRTRSSSSLVTDSAAGATAFSCGRKSYNGAISVLPSFDPCGSVMEAAKRVGYATGLVVTTRITDATPAAFASHVRRREMEDEIAMQMIGETHPLGRMVDLMIGGGRCHFLPNATEGGCRADGLDVIRLAREKHGWNYVGNKEDFDRLGTTAELPLLALLAPTDLPYEIDRRHQPDAYPSLEETAKKALSILSAATRDKDKGFFIMIEGSRIDHAGHANDPAAQVHEVLAYDRAMAAVLDFIEHSDVPTLMVSTSDHETGGLATARQLHEEYPDYLWHPSVLANASHSASHTAREYFLHKQHASLSTTLLDSPDEKSYLLDLIRSSLGIDDATPEELASLVNGTAPASYIFADMISRRAQTGWSTHGHSGADVNIYTSDPTAATALRGNHENTEVGAFLRSHLGLGKEVETITRKLEQHMKSVEGGADAFLGRTPDLDQERLDGQHHLNPDEYHGDHRTRNPKRSPGCGCGPAH